MQRLTTARGVWLGGLWSGVVAGTIMAAFLMVISGLHGNGFVTPMQLFAGVFYANPQLLGSSALLGFVFHLFNSAVIGVIFAAFVRYSTRVVATLLGLGVSLVIWGITTFVAIPLLDPALGRSLNGAMIPWFLAHLLFGATLMITPSMVVHWSERTPLTELPDRTEYNKAA